MYTFILPMAVPSETVTSTTTSCDCTSLIVTVIDNGPSSLVTKYSDCSNDTTNNVKSITLLKVMVYLLNQALTFIILKDSPFLICIKYKIALLQFLKCCTMSLYTQLLL